MTEHQKDGWVVRFGVGAVIALVAACALILSGCSRPDTGPPETVTREVKVPYRLPCPEPADKPVRPKRVAEEHPVMPADGDARERILAAKVLELFGYVDRADVIMTGCSAPVAGAVQ